jgi:hypothetical protein
MPRPTQAGGGQPRPAAEAQPAGSGPEGGSGPAGGFRPGRPVQARGSRGSRPARRLTPRHACQAAIVPLGPEPTPSPILSASETGSTAETASLDSCTSERGRHTDRTDSVELKVSPRSHILESKLRVSRRRVSRRRESRRRVSKLRVSKLRVSRRRVSRRRVSRRRLSRRRVSRRRVSRPSGSPLGQVSASPRGRTPTPEPGPSSDNCELSPVWSNVP